MTDDAQEELLELARSTRAALAWLKDSGVEEITATVAPAWTAVEPARAAVAPARAAVAPTRAAVAPTRAAVEPGRMAKPVSVAAITVKPVASMAERVHRLEMLASEVSSCTRCALHGSRTRTVFARGTPTAELMFVGEGPGAEEDRLGEPFVGPSGQLLDKMIAAMGYGQGEIYIANIVKCRAHADGQDRKPEPSELASCKPYLVEQIELCAPKVLVALGATAAQSLTGLSVGITELRGKWRLYDGRIPLMPTFHPAYLLRMPAKKRDAWDDLKQVMEHLGKAPAATSNEPRGD